jgi:hypothetical protein
VLAGLQAIGLDTAWVPLVVALIGLPTLYINLAMDAFKEYGELSKAFTAESYNHSEEVKLAFSQIEYDLQVFDVEWWVVGALGVLVFAMIGAASLPHAAAVPATGSGQVQAEAVKTWMSLYATGFTLLVGFRLVWARLAIARGANMLHAAKRRRSMRRTRRRAGD